MLGSEKVLMKNDYIAKKEEVKQSNKGGIWLMWAFIIIFISVIFRFAINTIGSPVPSAAPPTNDIAFRIAKNFVQPTIHFKDFQFAVDISTEAARRADDRNLASKK